MAIPHQQRLHFGSEMKKGRQAKGWTLKQLEQAMGEKNESVTTATLSNWETGKFVPREIQTVHVLDHVLDIAPTLVNILGYAPVITSEHLDAVMRTLEARPLSPEDMRAGYALIDWPDSTAPTAALAREITRLREAIGALLRSSGEPALVKSFADLITEAERSVDWEMYFAEGASFALAAESGTTDPGEEHEVSGPRGAPAEQDDV